MSTNNVTPAPVPAPDNSAPQIAAPAPQAAPDLSGLTQPGNSAQPNAQTAAVGSMQQAAGQMSAAATQAQKDAAQSTAPPPAGPHSTLLRMIQGLGIGLSSAATSMATRGKEGGAPEVQDYYARQQQQQIQAQQAREQAKDAKVRQDLTTFDTAHAMYQTYMNLATVPDELSKNHLDLELAKQDVTAKAQGTAIQLADFVKSNMGLKPTQIASPTTGTASEPITPAQQDFTRRQMTNFTGPNSEAITVLAPDEPNLKAVKDILARPISAQTTDQDTRDLYNAGTALSTAVQQKIASNKDKEAANVAAASDPVAKMITPEALASPGSQAAIQAKINDSATSEMDKVRLRRALPMAEVAQQNVMRLAAQKAKAEQAAKMGDPNAAGEQLATYGTTISELKSRGMTPDYVNQAITAANNYAKAHGAQPDAHGNYYNAPAADGYSKIAGSEQNNQFFGNVGSLVGPGGTLDQLLAAGNNISQSEFKILNKTKNWADLQSGAPGISAYGATAVAVADDYGKVMAGSAGSDTSRALALAAIDPSSSPEQRTAAVAQMKKGVNSQKNARIGNNPFLDVMYRNIGESGPSGGVLAGGDRGINFAAPTGATGKAKGSDGNMYWHDARGNILGPAPAGN